MLLPKGLDRLANHPHFRETSVGKILQQNPLGFIDIGARGGAHDLVEPLAKYTAVLGFEPDEDECKRLMQNPAVYEPWARFLLEPIALAEKKGNANLKLLSANTNHSLLSPNETLTKRYNMTKWQVIGSCDLLTDTLDNVIFNQLSQDILWGEFIKLDTQGTEYEILQGAARVLSERAVALVTEVAFCELYNTQKHFSEVELLLRQAGFSFYGFTSLHTRSKKLLNKATHGTRERLLYSDAIFFKDPLTTGAPIGERKTAVLFATACLLGFYDFAYELANETWLKTSNEIEKDHIRKLMLSLSDLPAQNAIQSLDQLSEKVKLDPEGANVSIGNFVDRRRMLCDYDDVLNVSPLPEISY